MSGDIMPCGCTYHADYADECHYPEAVAYIKELKQALEASIQMSRSLGQALMSPNPGEEAAIAQLVQGDSLIEKSILLNVTHKKLAARVVVDDYARRHAK